MPNEPDVPCGDENISQADPVDGRHAASEHLQQAQRLSKPLLASRDHSYCRRQPLASLLLSHHLPSQRQLPELADKSLKRRDRYG